MKSLRILFRRLLVLLLVSGMLAGNAAYAMPDGTMQEGTRTGQMALVVCEQVSAMPHSAGSLSTGATDHNTMSPDCLMMKQMACAQIPVLPEIAAGAGTAVKYAAVTYWSRADSLSSLTREPDLFPPITTG